MSTTRRGFLKRLGGTLVGALGLAASASMADAAAPGTTLVRTPQRQPLAIDQLAKLAGTVLDEWVAERRSFTAYDVTREVRARYPQFEVPHANVRSCVHQGMNALGPLFHYTAMAAQFPTGRAIQYLPA